MAKAGMKRPDTAQDGKKTNSKKAEMKPVAEMPGTNNKTKHKN